MINVQKVFQFENLCCFAKQPTHLHSSASKLFGQLYRFSLLGRSDFLCAATKPNDSEWLRKIYVTIFLHRTILFPTLFTEALSKICNFFSVRHGFAFLLNLFCFQSFPFVQSVSRQNWSKTKMAKWDKIHFEWICLC